MLLSQPGTRLRMDEPWVQAISACFKPGSRTRLPRPVGSFFVSLDKKVVYSPIAKCACTSLKHLMVSLAGLPHADLIAKHGVHRVTDAFITGAQLKDHELAVVEQALGDDSFYRFAVIREPVRRVISAYTEKFLLNREQEGNLIHTLDVLRDVRCQSRPDRHRGISFREFVDYILGCEPLYMDPHWKPQHLFLTGVDHFDDIFTMEQLGELSARLSRFAGTTVELERHNTSLARTGTGSPDQPGRYANTLPCELDGVGDIEPEAFMAPDLVMALERFYAEDLALYRAASNGQHEYRPAPFDLRSSAAETERYTLTSAPEIARCVNLYTKGFFALDSQGTGQLPVLINNTLAYPLDFSQLPLCTLVYEFHDAEGNVPLAPGEQTIAPGVVRPEGVSKATLHLSVPAEAVERISGISVSLRFGEEFHVVDVSPLHVAAARRAINSS